MLQLFGSCGPSRPSSGFVARINCRKIPRTSNWFFIRDPQKALDVSAWYWLTRAANESQRNSVLTACNRQRSFAKDRSSSQRSKFSLSFETNFEWKFGSWNQSSSSSYAEIALEMESWVLQIFAKRQINRRLENDQFSLFFVSCCIANRILIFFPLECIWWMSSFANELNSRSQWNKLFTLISVRVTARFAMRVQVSEHFEVQRQ